MSHFDDTRQFVEAVGHPISDRPQLPAVEWGEEGQVIRLAVRAMHLVQRYLRDAPPHLRRLRVQLMCEEMGEYLEAELAGELVGIADALGDMGVIADGTALAYGIPLDAVRDEIHRANMSKLDSDGIPIVRIDGKVLKGAYYTPPDIVRVLEQAQAEADT